MTKGTDIKIIIRNEREEDYKEVETMIRDAFYNLYVPGCAEHYVAHVIRGHEDFIKELDLVAEADGRIVASIMYTKAKLTNDKGEEKEILTFGPLAVAEEYQRRGLGKKLMAYSFEKAEKMGYDTVIIFGEPANYVTSGFKSCEKFKVSLDDGSYPSAMLVKELVAGALSGKSEIYEKDGNCKKDGNDDRSENVGNRWIYRQSPAFDIDEEAAELFDKGFEKKEKKYRPSQEGFYIHSRSFIKRE